MFVSSFSSGSGLSSAPQRLLSEKEAANFAFRKVFFGVVTGLLLGKLPWDGNRVEFELLTNAGHTQREATGVSIKEDFAKLGMKVNFKPVEFNSLVSKLSNTYDWDAVLIALTGNPLEPHSGYNVWSANGALHLFNQRSDEDMAGTDRILPFEKELNDIFNKAPLELDFNKRKALYDRYQEIVAKENPVIYLYSPVNIVAIRKKFKNIYPTELGGILHNIEEVYID